ncbi:TNT domain-containing protein [Kitasatospora sp. RB6PN24]|uniref:TNT domain-containing protein n=1 Tax=Kitasatospora humi TaxID=2893891 RepID=UPI001E3CC563|nr:TNT domain-containing protein [Kitasatospora humi]MCC9307798.1 TNT domain-containing protein [Kitasatospora humi]
MKLRDIIAVMAATTALFAGVPQTAGAQTPPRSAAHQRVGTDPTLSDCSAAYYDNDQRLGPLRLPVLGVVGAEVQRYKRTGDLSPQRFLDLYWNPTAQPRATWYYPPESGYVLKPDGSPERQQETLKVGQDVDRFGSEYGSFLAPEGTPYAERSLPPANLDGTPAEGCNYYDYRVVRAFNVYAGTIAPWFGQPGLGRQYQLDSTLVPGAPTQGFNVQWLVNNHYLDRVIQP